MGACASKGEAKTKTLMPALAQKIPEFYYLSRQNKEILHIKPESFTNFNFSKKLKIREDCAIGYLSENIIMIAGGSDRTGCLTNQVTIINPINKKASVIAKLPIAAKNGNLFQYDDFVYYVGGVMEGEGESSSLMVEPAPIMRYHMQGNYWEYFANHDQVMKHEIKQFLAKKVTEKFREEEVSSIQSREFCLNDLLNAGTFLYENKIYFVGGQRINSRGKCRLTKKVYSFNCNTLDLHLEPFKMPIKVLDPVCAMRSGKVVITGGINPIENKPNMQAYVLTFGDKVEFRKLEPLRYPLLENYPPISTKEASLFVSYPKVVYIDNALLRWSEKDIEELKSKAKASTDHIIEVETKQEEKVPVKTYHKIFTVYPFEAQEHKGSLSQGSLSSSEDNESDVDVDKVLAPKIDIEKEIIPKTHENKDARYEEIGSGGLKRLIKTREFDKEEFKRRLLMVEAEKQRKAGAEPNPETGFKDWIVGRTIETDELPEVKENLEKHSKTATIVTKKDVKNEEETKIDVAESKSIHRPKIDIKTIVQDAQKMSAEIVEPAKKIMEEFKEKTLEKTKETPQLDMANPQVSVNKPNMDIKRTVPDTNIKTTDILAPANKLMGEIKEKALEITKGAPKADTLKSPEISTKKPAKLAEKPMKMYNADIEEEQKDTKIKVPLKEKESSNIARTREEPKPVQKQTSEIKAPKVLKAPVVKKKTKSKENEPSTTVVDAQSKEHKASKKEKENQNIIERVDLDLKPAKSKRKVEESELKEAPEPIKEPKHPISDSSPQDIQKNKSDVEENKQFGIAPVKSKGAELVAKTKKKEISSLPIAKSGSKDMSPISKESESPKKKPKIGINKEKSHSKALEIDTTGRNAQMQQKPLKMQGDPEAIREIKVERQPSESSSSQSYSSPDNKAIGYPRKEILGLDKISSHYDISSSSSSSNSSSSGNKVYHPTPAQDSKMKTPMIKNERKQNSPIKDKSESSGSMSDSEEESSPHMKREMGPTIKKTEIVPKSSMPTIQEPENVPISKGVKTSDERGIEKSKVTTTQVTKTIISKKVLGDSRNATLHQREQ